MTHARASSDPVSPALDFVPRERIQAALDRISAQEYRDLDARIRHAAEERKVVFYPSHDRSRPIHIALRPWIFTATQREYFRTVYLHLEDAAKKLWDLIREDPETARLLPISDDERRWFEASFPGGRVPVQTLYGRLDASVDPWVPEWRSTFQVIELNLSGIGAAYYSWAAGKIAQEVLASALHTAEPGLALGYADDGLALILAQVRDHARAIGCARLRIALVQDESTLAGPYEFPTIAEIWRREGVEVQVVDPRALTVRDGELRAGDRVFDVLYRDPTLENLIDMEQAGADLTAMRFAFAQNRVVSGLVGEIDHKGTLEAIASERMAPRLGAAQRESIRRHVPWTRVLRPTRTTDPAGRDVDLFEYARAHRERLLLKPNRDYGGSGVVFGNETGAAEWDAALAEAANEPYGTVVQTAVPVYSERYPVVEGDRVEHRSYYNIAGFSGTPHGFATLARMARGKIINITRDGGVAGVLTCT